MYSLLQAAPYDNKSLSGGGSYDDGDEMPAPQQRRTANGRGGGGAKTIKKRPTGEGQPVEKRKCVEALMMMTGGDSDDDDDGSGLVDFNPPSKPQLTRVPQSPSANQHQQQQGQQQTQGAQRSSQGRTLSSQPSSYDTAHSPPTNLRPDVSSALAAVQASGAGPFATSSHQNNGGIQQPGDTKSINEQLNYIIHLLEEQQNIKTSTTTEELILYTFLGVFTIYIVDSFTKVGKSYTR